MGINIIKLHCSKVKALKPSCMVSFSGTKPRTLHAGRTVLHLPINRLRYLSKDQKAEVSHTTSHIALHSLLSNLPFTSQSERKQATCRTDGQFVCYLGVRFLILPNSNLHLPSPNLMSSSSGAIGAQVRLMTEQSD